MHTIRLRGFWSLDDDGRFRRSFHWVARLMARERVYLAFRPVGPEVDVWVNSQPLERENDDSAAPRFDITSLLATSNEVAIRAQAAPESVSSAEQLVREVRLEVDEVEL